MIVDDIPENISLLAASLEGTGYRITAATSGAEALRLSFSSHPPDIILLDVMMPDLDGYEVCRRLKSDPRTAGIPIIFITSLVAPEDEMRGLSLGATDYIHKPISPPVVRVRVANHLALANQNRELEIRVAQAVAEISETRREIIRRLGIAGEYRDNETGMHVLRVGRFSEILALHLGYSSRDASELREAAQMHDLGKIGIPDHILLKPGRYEPHERKIMEKHCSIGADILGEHSSTLLSTARKIALGHHEKWSGEGYPHGLSGEIIPLEARIVAIADVFDALITERPYKEAWSHEKAADWIISESGKSFDPDLVESFQSTFTDFSETALKLPDQLI